MCACNAYVQCVRVCVRACMRTHAKADRRHSLRSGNARFALLPATPLYRLSEPWPSRGACSEKCLEVKKSGKKFGGLKGSAYFCQRKPTKQQRTWQKKSH